MVVGRTVRSEPGYTENLRLPVVLVVHEGGGGLHVNDHAKEKALALALDIYGEGKITDLPQRHDESEPVKEQLLKERFLAAYKLLQDHKLTDTRGNPVCQYSESADRRSWGAMLRFFDETIE